MRKYAYVLLFLLIPFICYALTLNGKITSNGEDSSIVAMQYSIWSMHSFSLGSDGNLVTNSVDVALYNGNYYSAISPGMGLVSLPFASVGFLLDGGHFTMFGYATLMDELFLAVCSSLAVFFAYKTSRFYAPETESLLAALALGLSTSVWPFSTVIFPQGASLLFSIASVYFMLRYTKASSRDRNLVISGLCLGMACFIEYVAALFALPILGYLLAKGVRRKSVSKLFVSFLVGPFVLMSYNYSIFGNPLAFPEQFKVGSTSASLLAMFNPVNMIGHFPLYFVSPYRGLLLLSPVVVLGMYELYRALGSSAQLDGFPSSDAALFVILFALVLMTYSAWQDWAGGLAYGPRFMILGLPYLVIPVSTWMSRNKSASLKLLFLALFVMGSFVQGAGALTSAFSVNGDPSTYQPLAYNIPALFQGKLDTWWIAKLGLAGGKLPLVFAAFVFVLAWIPVVLLIRRNK